MASFAFATLSTPHPSANLSSLSPSHNFRFSTSLSADGHSASNSRRRLAAVSPRASPSTSFYSSSSSSAITQVGDLDRLSVYSAATGNPVAFSDLWKPDEVAVVALMRHFGCFCCWELASVLKEQLKPKLDSAGVKLIAIGVGTTDKAHILAERLPFPSECLFADPDRKVYEALGLYYGFGRTFLNPASAKVFSRGESIQKATKNYTINATPDDKSGVLQQGGMLVFRGKELVYARKDEGTGDHAPLNEVLQYCCS